MRDSIGTATSLDGLEVQIGSNSDIAVYQELGTQHMPPRSFLGGAMADKLPEIKEIIGRSVVAALVGEEVYEGSLLIEG
jgi:HK97 gp10 family phage protein